MLCLCGQGLLGHICYIPFLQRDGAVYGSFSRACEYGEGGWWAHCTAHCSSQWSLGRCSTTCFSGMYISVNVAQMLHVTVLHWLFHISHLCVTNSNLVLSPFQTTCNLNAKNHLKQLTPLRFAVERGYSRIVEVLVGYGADVNMTCSDGHTPLHVVTTNKDMKKPTSQTPQLQRVTNWCKPAHYIWFMEYSTRNSACIDECRHESWENGKEVLVLVWLIGEHMAAEKLQTAKYLAHICGLPDVNTYFTSYH